MHWVQQGDPVPAAALSGIGVLVLQREVPEPVNLAAAQAAVAAGIPVVLVSDPDACKGLTLTPHKRLDAGCLVVYTHTHGCIHMATASADTHKTCWPWP